MSSWLVARRDADGTASVWNLANVLTVVRILLVPVLAVLLLAEGGQDAGWRLAAFVAFVVAIATDKVDGELARRHDLVTDFGKVADPIADKALIGTALVLLSVLGELPWWITVVVLGRELAVTVLRFVVIRHGVMAASRGGKLKTVLQSVATSLYLLPTPDALPWKPGLALAVMLLAVAVTVVTGVDYALSAHRLRRTSERTARRRGDAVAAASTAVAAPTLEVPAEDAPASAQPPRPGGPRGDQGSGSRPGGPERTPEQ